MKEQTKIAIIGLGQMGGSLGLALKSKAMKNRYHITGIARKQETLKAALKIGAADKVSLSLQDAKGCDIAVICTPVDTIIPIYKQLSKIIDKNTIITDTGSVKEEIEKQIIESGKWKVESGKNGNITGLLRQDFVLPRNDSQKMSLRETKVSKQSRAVNSTFHSPLSTLPFVAVHPMAGRENNGIMSADAEMFKNANVIITGSVKKSLQNEKIVAKMWKDAGANIINMPAKKHDELTALTSHLAHCIAFSFNKIYKDIKKKNPEIDRITAGSFKSITRVASSSADMWAPIFAANGKNIIKHLDAFIKELNAFKKVLKNKNKVKQKILQTQGKAGNR